MSWTETATKILEAKLDRTEVDQLLYLMAAEADKTAVGIFSAGDVLPGIVFDVEVVVHLTSKVF